MQGEFASLSQTLIVMPANITGDEDVHYFVQRLLHERLILAEDWEALTRGVQERIRQTQDEKAILELLIKYGLLTRYQADRIAAGTIYGLILGNYRVLERLGAGGMAVVFKGEHLDLRHHVAIKVLPPTSKEDIALESRFFSEMRTVARLRHPNIVAAHDAGRVLNEETNTALRFLVMEYVTGLDLEETICQHGPMATSRAVGIAYHIASALSETHKHNLVHRDIKPSNIMLTEDDQAKLLDFGLSRHFGHRMTVPGTVLGTIDYMAPEQARDASSVDIRADIYSLGGTLYWCLTGQLPFPFQGSPIEALARRLNKSSPSLRTARPELPPELDRVMSKMMALDPEDRYPNPQAVMQALLPFLKTSSIDYPAPVALEQRPGATVYEKHTAFQIRQGQYRVLIVDDEPAVRDLCKPILEADGAIVTTASSGLEGIASATREQFDLMLLDVNMPDITGFDVLTRIRQQNNNSNLKIIIFSGNLTSDEMSLMLTRGADDFLMKPFAIPQFRARIHNMLRLRMAQDKTASLNHHLVCMNQEFEKSLEAGDGTLGQMRDGLMLTLGRMVELREGRTGRRVNRVQQYCRTLAWAAAKRSAFAGQLHQDLIDTLSCCAPVYDIGKMSIPDYVLLKPGELAPNERLVMESHTIVAADLLKEVLVTHGNAVSFLSTAVTIARSHHERFDGTGYPDGLSGEDIPLVARIVSIADAYEGLRSKRPYKPALPHPTAQAIISIGSPGQFDPALLEVFEEVAPDWDAIFRDHPE
jgi:response regulator RpfG family c-di-GMP phosphodiesterase